MRVVSEQRIWRDEVYLEVYPDHLAPVHQLERTRIADFCPRNPQSGFATYCRTVNTPHRSAKISPFYESIEVLPPAHHVSGIIDPFFLASCLRGSPYNGDICLHSTTIS